MRKGELLCMQQLTVVKVSVSVYLLLMVSSEYCILRAAV